MHVKVDFLMSEGASIFIDIEHITSPVERAIINMNIPLALSLLRRFDSVIEEDMRERRMPAYKDLSFLEMREEQLASVLTSLWDTAFPPDKESLQRSL